MTETTMTVDGMTITRIDRREEDFGPYDAKYMVEIVLDEHTANDLCGFDIGQSRHRSAEQAGRIKAILRTAKKLAKETGHRVRVSGLVRYKPEYGGLTMALLDVVEP